MVTNSFIHSLVLYCTLSYTLFLNIYIYILYIVLYLVLDIAIYSYTQVYLEINSCT